MESIIKHPVISSSQGRSAGAPSRLLRGVWRLADPKITLASVASLVLGTAAAAADGAIAWGWVALTWAGIFFLEAAKNASGEIFDWDSGTDLKVAPADRSPFSGGKRVIVDGLLTRRQTAIVAAAFYALGIAAGLAIVLLREPRVLWVGMAGVALAFFYHAPPLKLSYRGLGEIAVALTYGPLIACGSYLVQRHTITREAVLVTLPLALLMGAFLFINEFPDAHADAASGKRTLVVRLGRRRASRVFGGIVAVAFSLLAILPLFGLTPWIWIGFGAMIPAVLAAQRLASDYTRTARIIPAQAWTLIAFLLLSAGAAAGMMIQRWYF